MGEATAKSSIDRDTVLATIRQHADELRAMQVTAVYLFGSLARGDTNAGSDVDLLVEIEKPFGLFKVGGVQVFFEDLLHTSVDVVPVSCLDPRIRDDVYRDRIRVI